MQHCTQPTYLSDNFCEECGDELINKPQLKTIEACAPHCLDALKKHYPSTEVGTGIVESVYFYKRRFKDKENDITYSYCWLTMSLASGEKVQYSISAENKVGANLKVGDVITLFKPCDYTLGQELIAPKLRETVTHDGYVDYVINHDNDKQASVSGGSFKPDEKRKPSFFLIPLVLVPSLAYLFLDLSQDMIVNLATVLAVLTVILLVIEWVTISSKYKKEVSEFEAIESVFHSIKNISRKQLGYKNLHRVKRDTDVICIHCQQRISSDVAFCHSCGSSQGHPLEYENENKALNCDIEADGVKSVNASISIKDLEDNIKAEYALEYQAPFEYANFFSTSFSGTMDIECVIGKVIDRKVAADVSDVTTITTKTKTKTTDYYTQKGDFVRTERDISTSKSKHRLRNSNLFGFIVLSTAHGIITLKVPEQQILTIDIGDWMYYQDCEVNTVEDDRKRSFRLNLSNLTKDKGYGTEGLDLGKYSEMEERSAVAYFGFSLISTIPIYFISKAYDINLYAWPEAINGFLGSPLNGFFMFFYPTIFYTLFAVYRTIVLRNRRKNSITLLENSLGKAVKLESKVCENLKQLQEKFTLFG